MAKTQVHIVYNQVALLKGRRTNKQEKNRNIQGFWRMTIANKEQASL